MTIQQNQNETPAQEASPAPAQDPAKVEAKPEEKVEEIDWKAMARKWEKNAKANADAATRLKEIEDAQKTEAEKQAERLAELERELQTYKVETAKHRVATEFGVPADVLRGSTEDELKAHAEALKGLLKAEQPEGKPKDPVPGFGSVAGSGSMSLGDQIALAESEKNWSLARQLKSIQVAQQVASNGAA